MTDDRIDEETLAAFLDGTLPPAERAAVVQRLASDPEAYASFVEASQVSLQVSGSPAVVAARMSRSRWGRNLTLAGPFVAAAGIAAAVFLSRGSSGPDTIEWMRSTARPAVSGPGSLAAAFGSDWNVPGWSVVRGADEAPTPGTAGRLGARLVQLEYAAQASDTVALRMSADATIDLLSTVGGSSAEVQRLRSPEALSATDRDALVRRVRDLADAPAAFDAGVWLESARLAVLRKDQSFFAAVSYDVLADIVDRLDAASPGADWQLFLGRLRALAANRPPDAGAAVTAALASLPR